jgi:MFS transporter, ACS family, tartrate transporter
MFMPAIIKSQTGATDRMATFLASIPFLMGFLAMQVNGWHSDWTGERPWHVAIPLAFMGLGILFASWTDGVFLLPALIMMFWVGTCMYAHLPAFWPIPNMFLGATAAASAIGFINMIGNLGGSVGPTLVGGEASGTVGFASALRVLGPWPLVASAIILIVGYLRRRTKPGERLA